MIKSEVILIGGGLAGLIAGIHLRKNNIQVIIIEKNTYPKHKVCGEYLSNEVLPYLKSLDLNIESLQPKYLNKLSFSLVSGKTIDVKLPLGGLGISRYQLDYYLYKEALKTGCIFIEDTVTKVQYFEEIFTVITGAGVYHSKIVMGAFGKRSNLDVAFNRTFIKTHSDWLGVKAHYKLEFPDDLVGLHHFKGGYCGVSKIENNQVNICYLASYATFKNYKSIEEYQQKILNENPNLKTIFQKATLQFEKPLTISQISFKKKERVENHVLMIGDTAGVIHPLCGNGMAMAIHSAKLASEKVIDFLNIKISRPEMEVDYIKSWNLNFKKRMVVGTILGHLLQKEKTAQMVLKTLVLFPFLLPMIIKKTHGKSI